MREDDPRVADPRPLADLSHDLGMRVGPGRGQRHRGQPRRERPGRAGSGLGDPQAPKATPPSPPGTTPAKSKSKIFEDRMSGGTNEPIKLSEQKETSPFRFTEIHKEAGVDFIQYSGMTVDKHFPPPTARAWPCSTTTMTASSTSTSPPAPTCPGQREAARTTVSQPRQQQVRGRHRKAGVGYAGFCHGVAAATSTTTGTRTCSSATSDRTSCTSTTATARSPTSARSSGIRPARDAGSAGAPAGQGGRPRGGGDERHDRRRRRAHLEDRRPDRHPGPVRGEERDPDRVPAGRHGTAARRQVPHPGAGPAARRTGEARGCAPRAGEGASTASTRSSRRWPGGPSPS